MKEQRIVVLGADRGAVELVVVGVLQADAGVEPRPARRLADSERDVGDLRRSSRCCSGVMAFAVDVHAVQGGVGGAPDVEILAGENEPVVAAIGKRGLQLQAVEQIVRIGRRRPLSEARVQPSGTRECSCRAASASNCRPGTDIARRSRCRCICRSAETSPVDPRREARIEPRMHVRSTSRTCRPSANARPQCGSSATRQ